MFVVSVPPVRAAARCGGRRGPCAVAAALARCGASVGSIQSSTFKRLNQLKPCVLSSIVSTKWGCHGVHQVHFRPSTGLPSGSCSHNRAS
eukprot:441026-Prymnesium_polylepis.1